MLILLTATVLFFILAMSVIFALGVRAALRRDRDPELRHLTGFDPAAA